MHAPDFPHDARWLSSPPLNMKDMRGKKIVLVDFWTYSCVNCIRTLPHLKKWHAAYAPLGFVIIGVHTPEFEFEKDISNVKRAIKESGIEYPVVIDSDYQIWSSYANSVWPRKFLINKEGHIVYDHAGEGGYGETEEQIQKALLELSPEIKLPAITDDEIGSGGVCLPTTPETYLGSMRGQQGRVWRAIGEWKSYPEFIEYEKTTENFEGYITLNFDANEVNLVMESRSERPAKLRIELDGKPLKDIEVKEPKMYNLIINMEHASMEHGTFPKRELKIFVKDQGFRAYAFTFGGCA
ncbi:MAG: redoxin domain-containing protein [Candidatus Liptonbacteria bacterium]|nr:redoxin domain-containing protein [Candidatus Liptonbacteria bacterium]